MTDDNRGKQEVTRLRQVIDLAICFLFLAIVTLPTVDKFLGLDTAKPRTENRALATPPARPVNLEKIIDYPPKFEEWFKDHFGFRNRLLKTYSRLNRKLFGIIKQVTAVKSDAGWFFYTGEDIADYHRGRPPFTREELDQWRDELVERKTHTEANGGHYLLVIIPNKSTVYPEQLLDWMKAEGETTTRADQLIEHLGGNDDLNILDLRRPVILASRNERIYHKADTHWNDLGAFVGASLITESLAEWFPQLRPLSRSNFNLTYEDRQGGDLATMYGVKEQTTEVTPILTPESGYAYAVTDEQNYTDLAGMSNVTFTSSDNAPIPRVVIVRDSCTEAMLPFLSDFFARGVYLWTYQYPAEAIEVEKPDVVVDIFVERILQHYKPKQDKNPAHPL